MYDHIAGLSSSSSFAWVIIDQADDRLRQASDEARAELLTELLADVAADPDLDPDAGARAYGQREHLPLPGPAAPVPPARSAHREANTRLLTLLAAHLDVSGAAFGQALVDLGVVQLRAVAHNPVDHSTVAINPAGESSAVTLRRVEAACSPR